jgi:hypothetical protein
MVTSSMVGWYKSILEPVSNYRLPIVKLLCSSASYSEGLKGYQVATLASSNPTPCLRLGQRFEHSAEKH